jgi:hypothetical protein
MIEPSAASDWRLNRETDRKSDGVAATDAGRQIAKLSTESVNNSKTVWITSAFNHIVPRVA